MKLFPALLAAVCALSTGIVCNAVAQPPALVVQTAPPLTDLEVRQLAPVLRQAEEQGLARPGDAALLDQLAAPPPATREALRQRMILYAAEARSGRIDPIKVDRRWTVRPQPVDAAAGFEAARSMGMLAQWLAGLPPQTPVYRGLLVMRRFYLQRVAQGGWKTLAAKASPAEVRVRLEAEGYLSPVAMPVASSLPAAPTTSAPSPGAVSEPDPLIAAALAAFQSHHGLTADGKLGAATRAALNVSAQTRLTQIDVNLERLRWLPRTPPSRRIEVDVGQAMAVVYEADQPVLTMRIIVGAPAASRQTPLFASSVRTVVLNPPWNVPSAIAANEIMPKVLRDPTYLAKNHYSLTGGRLVQAPGPDRALGEIKFDFPSPFGVYLHDTPSRSLFARDKRTFSHGCMRVEKPHQLAEYLLADQGMTPQAINQAIAAGGTRAITVNSPLPLQVTYSTVSLGTDGALNLLEDVYGWDAKLAAALTRTP